MKSCDLSNVDIGATSAPHSHQLKILSWDVNGDLKAKMLCPDFLNTITQYDMCLVTIFSLCSFLVIIVLLHLSIFPLNFHLFHMHSIAVHIQPHPQSCCLHIASCTVSYTATLLSI